MSDRIDLTPTDDRTPEELAGVPVPQGPDAEGFEDPTAPLPPGPEELLEGPAPLEVPDVRRWLERVGKVASWALPAVEDGFEPDAWQFTEEELGEISPPLTRVLNRRAAWLRGLIRNTDEIEVGFLLLEYVTANLERARAANQTPTPDADAGRVDLEEGDPARGPATFGLGAEE